MNVGIEKLDLYAGRCFLDIANLADARGQDVNYVTQELMCQTRSIYPPYEDSVTLAVNAAKKLLSPEDINDIELLIVSTETAVDMGKPVSTWVHRFCELAPNCRNFEVKHACYGFTGALKMAASWVVSGIRPGKKALIINSDLSPQYIEQQHEIGLGGAAVAALVSNNPQILTFEMEKTGYWTHEIPDTFRPTPSVEIVNDQTSLFSYLDALDGAFGYYEKIVGEVDYQADFKKHLYHAPFPAMTFQAHRSILNRFGSVKKKEAKRNFEEKVKESLYFSKRIGTAYGSSTMIGLLGLLTISPNLEPNDRISIFAYGSGCHGEFYSALIGSKAIEIVRSLNIDQHLAERKQLTLAQYEENEYARERYIGCSNQDISQNIPRGIYEDLYKNQGLLVLKSIDENFQRTYEWS